VRTLLLTAALFAGYTYYFLSMNLSAGEFCLVTEERLQSNPESCGFAALAMYLSVQGIEASEQEIMAYLGRHDWMTFADMLEYVQYRGMQGHGLEVAPSFFLEHSMLSIVHLEEEHYVVYLTRLPGEKVLIFDPAVGYQILLSSQLAKQMTGYVFYAYR